MRLLYFGDKHERVTSPENRLDDFRETQRKKTQEIISIGKKYGVTAFLQPGDFFDSPNPPLDFVAEVMEQWTGCNLFEVFAKYVVGAITQEEAMQAVKDYVPIIGVAGNHELFGGNLKTLPKTAIGFINKMGLMRFATKEDPYFFYTDDGLKVAITGTHYHIDIDHPDYLDDYIVEEKLGDFHIHIVHGMLSDRSMGKHIRHTLIDHIKHTKADLTITGHDHIGFPLIEVDGKFFVNPGAPIRMSNDLKEINRTPQVMLIDITKAGGLRIQMIPLQSAQKGELVLSRQKIAEKKKREERLEEFKRAVRDANIKRSTDIVEIIRDLADDKSIPIDVRNEVLDRISEKKKEMNSDFSGVVQEAYVTKIVLENFQSHGYTELDCSRELNIFVGESRQGKTAVLRAFQWVYENKPSGRRIIKTGEDYAKVTLYLSNGYVISRYMERKQNGKNGYYITDPATGETSFHNTKILPEVQKLLGYTPFVIDSDLQFNLNFMKQGAGWFLIGDQFTAPVRAKIIGAIYGTQYADAVSRELDADEKRIHEKIRECQSEIGSLDEQIQAYRYLEELGNTISRVEHLLKEVEELKQRKEKILSLLQKRRQLEEVIEENQRVLSRLNHIEQLLFMFEQLKLDVAKRNQLVHLIEKRTEIATKYRLLEESLHATRHLDTTKQEFEALRDLVARRNELKKATERRQKILILIQDENEILDKTRGVDEALKIHHEIQQNLLQRKEWKDKVERTKRLEENIHGIRFKLQAIEETLGRTKALELAKQLYEEMRVVLDRKEKINKLLEARTRLSSQIVIEDANIKKYTEEMNRLIHKYQSLLEEAGSCPVCHGTIDKQTAKRIVQEYQTA